MKHIDVDAPDDVLRILVGNKSDLHNRIVISTQDGKKLANQYHVDFFETSAKSDTSQNVSKIFYFLTEKLLELKQPISNQSTGSINLSNNQSNSMYEKLTGCCSLTALSPTTVEK
jgi:GTPase SAR1 family protein